MRTRIRLFKISGGSAEFGDLQRGVREFPFDSSRGRGFRLRVCSENNIEGVHIHQRERKFVSLDLDGEEKQQTVSFFERVGFEFDLMKKVLSLKNPPRSTKAFFRDILQVSGGGVGFSEFALDISECVRLLEKRFRVNLTGFELKDVAVTPTLGYRVSVFGSEDLREDILQVPFPVSKNYRKAKMELYDSHDSTSIEIRESGIIIISAPEDDPIIFEILKSVFGE